MSHALLHQIVTRHDLYHEINVVKAEREKNSDLATKLNTTRVRGTIRVSDYGTGKVNQVSASELFNEVFKLVVGEVALNVERDHRRLPGCVSERFMRECDLCLQQV